MLRPVPPLLLGRLAAACWLVVTVLLVRMATNGSFLDLALDDEVGTQASLPIIITVVAALALLLAVSLVRSPRSRALVISAGSALLLIPFAAVLLAVNHASALALPPLGTLTALFSIRAWRGLEPPVGGL